MNREELAKLRSIHDTKGLRLDTASGLSGSIYDADGSATAPVTALLDECARSFGKDAEITKLKSQLETLRGAMKADDERLRAAGLRSDCYAGCDTPEAMADNIELLKSQLEEARAAIRDYLDEFDAPVKDYALRAVLRTKLRALIAGSTK